jgi:hypothetical protein
MYMLVPTSGALVDELHIMAGGAGGEGAAHTCTVGKVNLRFE